MDTYIPLITKPEYEARTVRHVVDKVFDGTPLALAKQLINTSQLTAEEIKELRSLLDKEGSAT